MGENLLEVRNLSKRFGGFVALNDISFDVAAGERVGLIGPNGSGKSTFVNCISGTLMLSTGTVSLDRRRIEHLAPHQRTRMGLARSFQLPRPFGSMSVADNLKVPMLYAGRGGEAGAMQLLEQIGLADKSDKLPRELTQIELRKLELARAMAANPRLLIADEAMAGLSHTEVDELLALLLRLSDQGVAIIMIEHIMRAVMAFSQRIACFVAGQKVADGDPQDVIRHPEVLRAYLGE
ncbi:MAG: ABC transporter ATP-binding protein [Acetobacteraceae bacterium]|nr:ABC transporter ATP-binding protein [Acetobacteraceae bacterium]